MLIQLFHNLGAQTSSKVGTVHLVSATKIVTIWARSDSRLVYGYGANFAKTSNLRALI